MNDQYEISLQATNSDGDTEYLYSCSYIDSEGKKRSIVLHAKDIFDAISHLEALRSSGEVEGRILSVQGAE